MLKKFNKRLLNNIVVDHKYSLFTIHTSVKNFCDKKKIEIEEIEEKEDKFGKISYKKENKYKKSSLFFKYLSKSLKILFLCYGALLFINYLHFKNIKIVNNYLGILKFDYFQQLVLKSSLFSQMFFAVNKLYYYRH